MSFISTSTISILVYGSKTYFFSPSRGIWQGDPMSPYNFILCVKMISVHINHQVDIGIWEPIRISPKAPPISHIFYADDLAFMSRANPNSIVTINNSLKKFVLSLANPLITPNQKLSSPICAPIVLFR